VLPVDYIKVALAARAFVAKHAGTTKCGRFSSSPNLNGMAASGAGHTKPFDGAIVTINICIVDVGLNPHRMCDLITNAVVEV
jgi:hypothetical protein